MIVTVPAFAKQRNFELSESIRFRFLTVVFVFLTVDSVS